MAASSSSAAPLGATLLSSTIEVTLPNGEVRRLTPAEFAFFATASDPFGDARNGADLAPRIPDWNPLDCYTVKRMCEWEYQIVAATNPRGVIKMAKPNTSSADAFCVYYSAAGAAAPTAEVTAESFPWETGAITTAVGSKWRWVASGLKVWVASTADHPAGTFRGGNFQTAVHTGSGTWATYADITPYMENKSYPAEKGITTRLCNRWNGATGTHGGFADQWAALTTSDRYNQCGFPAPTVMMDGFGDCTLHIQAVEWVEFSAPSGSILTPTKPSVYGDNCLWLYNRLADYNVIPMNVAGHSFKSYVTKVGGVLRSAASSPLLGPVASALLGPEAGAMVTAGQEAARAINAPGKAKNKQKAKEARGKRRG